MMGKGLGLGFALLLAGLSCLAQAQTPQRSFPPGAFTGRGALDAAAGGGGYQGPLDVVSTSIKGWWGLRCGSGSYTGNVARVKSPSDALTTTITCTSGGTLGSTGTAIATTCGTSCTVDILYDQSGIGSCGGACDLIQTTESKRPTYILNCIGSLPCMRFVSANVQVLRNSAAAFTQAQPLSYATVANQDGTGANQDILSTANSETDITFGSATNVNIYAGSALTASGSVTNNVFASLMGVFNSTSSIMTVNTADTTGDAGTNAPSSANVAIGGYGGSDILLLDGRVTEAGIWGLGFSGTQRTNLYNNAHTYWGFP